MWLLLCTLFLSWLSLVKLQNSDNKNVTANITVANITVLPKNLSGGPFKPIQVIERRNLLLNTTEHLLNETNIKKIDDFKPSPQIGGFDNSFFLNQQSKSFESYPAPNWAANVWSDNSVRHEESSIESPWKNTPVKFPAPTEARPYPFGSGYETPTTVSNPIELVYKQPLQPPVRHQVPPPPQIYPQRQPEGGMWQKFLSFAGLDKKFPVSSPKSFYSDHGSYPGNQLDHSVFPGEYLDPHSFNEGNKFDHSYHGYSYGPKEPHHSIEPHHGDGGISPFKKILKVLAAIIPIGLFLSALTPTIITVSSANDTTGRFNRNDDTSENLLTKVANSLNSLNKLQQDGCQQKVFCELMVNAMFSTNAEEHIKNLLDNFVDKSGTNEDTFTTVLEAVKNQDCSTLSCKDMADPT
uniref:Uncharacterized protein LOC114342529 n=1 Tax=Diabrotica virgifera virgifera TaxID=50390 RepID=A0A6P7GH42_DIAVI